MQPVMVARWGIDPATKATRSPEQKRELVQPIKHWRVSIDARGDLAHAVITGGVSVREVDPKTMQSKKALGLYFCRRSAGCGCPIPAATTCRLPSAPHRRLQNNL